MTKLVIVESPTKIKSLSKFLPSGYKVASCVGHIRDLPSSKSKVPKAIRDKDWADFAVDVEGDFTPYYVTIPGKAKVITELKKKLKDADELYLATDEDREGESISWHLVEALKPKVPVRRMVFNEITKEAIQRALENPRDIDMDLVQAQETRRILDRLYGYSLSPLLWKKIGGNLSAGRVQSVAVRLVVMRERERRAFVSGTYWDLKATLAQLDPAQGGDQPFEAKLVTLDGQRIATGKDFDKDTGKLADGSDVLLLEEDKARQLEAELRTRTWTITNVDESQRQNKPFPPYITSTLQQDANYRLNMSARHAMTTAQRLYEQGLITYMRTDSVTLSEEGLNGARDAVRAEFGPEYVPEAPRTYKDKKTRGAQEAHEAIRPAGREFVHPDQSGLTGDEFKLYRLIWQRTLACQMPNERYTSTSVTVEVGDEATGIAEFTATGKRVDFPGFRLAYPTQGDQDNELPPVAVGDTPDCRALEAVGHETKPPARYTEATLVRALEEEGIGRPSTYADILQKIMDKGYVLREGKALVPTLTAFAVTGLLEKHFAKFIDLQFTAAMEEKLDEIAAGEADWLPYLKEFFQGTEGLQHQVEARMEEIDPKEARDIDLVGLPEGFSVKTGRFGPYVEGEVDGERVSADIPEGTTPDMLTDPFIRKLLERKAEGPRSLGEDPETGKEVFLLTGRYGPYVQLGEVEETSKKGTGKGKSKGKGKAKAKKPPRSSLPKGMSMEDITLDEAVFLLRLPRELGEHPAGGKVIAGLGRYGPYVAHDPGEGERTIYANASSYEALKTVTLDEALEAIKEKKAKGGRGGRGGRRVIKDFGEHEGKPLQLLDGRYGPYVKYEKTNATVPKGTDLEELTKEDAVSLVEEKREKKGG